MSTFKQIGAVTVMNLRSLPTRLGASLVVIVGIAGVVGVIVSVFGMTRSLEAALLSAGHPDRALVLKSGASNELSSTLASDAVLAIKDAPGIVRNARGEPAASADLVTAVNLIRKEDGQRSGVSIRGVEPGATALRPEVRIVEGRAFEPGLKEIVVGRSAQDSFRDVSIGEQVVLRDGPWTVVGVFESGDVHESGLLADASTLMSAYQRVNASSVSVLLESEAAFDELKAALTTNPALSVTVEREDAYYRNQSEDLNGFFDVVTYVIGGIMALGALFAALNTMYSAVSARAVEIATLRAIGFGSGGVVVSVLVEALLLALVGALLGAAVAWALFSGNTISMGNNVGALVVEMRVTPALLGVGVLWACVVGFVGGLFPAIRAARLPVATALRAV